MMVKNFKYRILQFIPIYYMILKHDLKYYNLERSYCFKQYNMTKNTTY